MMSVAQMISTAFLVVILVTIESASMVIANQASVNIYNLIEGGESINTTCGSFGDKTIRYGEHLRWTFTPSI